jgi:dihydropteroate synthase
MKKTKIIAILNITPDSFSDGQMYNTPEMASDRLKKIIANQPDLIDIGAISTRAYKDITTFPSPEEELERFKLILPAIAPILKSSEAKISIDSFNPSTIEYLLNHLDIALINDQKACNNPAMIDLIKNTSLKVSIMHHLDIPTDPTNIIPESSNATEVVKEWLLRKADHLIAQGIAPEQIIIDPGIGFAKNATQSWQIIKEARTFANLGFPVIYGHSRKSFLNSITNKIFAERDLETSIISLYLARCGVDYIRVHDAELNARALIFQEQDLLW